MPEPLPLAGRVALVTGVSRRAGIGAAVARILAERGATVVASGWPPHDAEMPWGPDDDPGPLSRSEPGERPFRRPPGSEADGLGRPVEQRDLEDPAEPERLVDHVIDEHGALDIVVAAHARSSALGLADVTATELDRCWAANVRSIVLLAQRFATVHDLARPSGRMIWFTSGQHLQPMPGEIAYAVTKGALHQMTATLADALIDRGIVANCLNPGPVDTGWADGALHEQIAAMFPAGRWSSPDEVARIVAFLASDDGGLIQGQVIDAEGGFRRGSARDR